MSTDLAAGRPKGINWFGYWQPVAYASCGKCRLTVQYNLAIGHLVHCETVPLDDETEIVGCDDPWPDCRSDVAP